MHAYGWNDDRDSFDTDTLSPEELLYLAAERGLIARPMRNMNDEISVWRNETWGYAQMLEVGYFPESGEDVSEIAVHLRYDTRYGDIEIQQYDNPNG